MSQPRRTRAKRRGAQITPPNRFESTHHVEDWEQREWEEQPDDPPALSTQFITDHLKRFGAIQIPREAYLSRLQEALAVEARFHSDAGEIVSRAPWPLNAGSMGSSQSTTQRS